jgi:hypothetical protein
MVLRSRQPGLNEFLKRVLPSRAMYNPLKARPRTVLEQLETAELAQLFPVIEHHVDCISVFEVFEHHEIVSELRAEVALKPACSADVGDRSELFEDSVPIEQFLPQLFGGLPEFRQNMRQHFATFTRWQNLPIDRNGFQIRIRIRIGRENIYRAGILLEQVQIREQGKPRNQRPFCSEPLPRGT